MKIDAGYHLNFAVQYQGNLSLEVLNIKDFFVSFNINPNAVYVTLCSGKFDFFDLPLELYLKLQTPSKLLTAELSTELQKNTNDEPSNQKVGEEYLSSLKKSSNSAIKVESVRFRGALRLKNYTLHVSASNILNLHNKIVVHKFQADINYLGMRNSSDYSIFAYTDLEVKFEENPLTISLTAELEKFGKLKRWKFSGSQHHPVTVQKVLNDLAGLFTKSDYHLPEFIGQTKLNYLGLSFEVISGPAREQDYTFTFGLAIPIGEKEVKLDMYAHYKKVDSDYALELTGTMFLDGFQLAVGFAKQGGKQKSDTLVLGAASYEPELEIDSRYFINALAPSLLDRIPIDVKLHLGELLLGLHGEKTTTPSQRQKDYLFRFAFALDFNLERFPLIGKMLKEINFKDGLLLAANPDWKRETVSAANNVLGLIKPSPAPLGQSQSATSVAGLAKGISLSGTLHITEALEFPLFLNFGSSDTRQSDTTTNADTNQGKSATDQETTTPKQTAEQPATNKPASTPDQRSQSKVDQVISAVRIKKIGLIFEDGRLGLKITGGLALATFEFELIGMQLTVPQSVLKDPADITDISFSLEGFGASIQKGKLSVVGGFLRMQHEEYEEYAGVIQVSLPKFSLAGLGSYAEFPKKGKDKHTSLFLFVALGFPIPVHPSLLIEGMCLGFGIHRNFIDPKPGGILTFPLVQLAVTPPPPIDIDDLLKSVGEHFPVLEDKHFLVAGISFRAFGTVKTLAMLVMKFGREFEISLIGVSSIEFPALFIELGWQAHFVPAKGDLFIGGQLTSRSHLLLPEVNLTGGFSVAAWTKGKHQGDFVVSVGGYHPHFNVPDHYPNHIPRLGISFDLDPFTIKGGAYFAITPKCLMMGGYLKASLDDGWIEAYVKIHLDAILFFEPFHYDVHLNVEAGVKATIGTGFLSHDFDEQVDIDVHIWGPEFSGKVSFDIGPKTFEKEIGEDSSPRTHPLHWHEFEEKFLKTKDNNGRIRDNVCNISITEGLVRKVKWNKNGKEVEYHVINPKVVEIEAKSLIPLTEQSNSSLGITPMDLRGGKYSAKMSIEGNENFGEPEDIRDSVPTGIWGANGLKKASMSSAESGLIKDVLTGQLFTAKPDKATTETPGIPKGDFNFNIDKFKLKYASPSYQLSTFDNKVLYEKPFNQFEAFTGLSDEEFSQFDHEVLQKTKVLSYELVQP